VSAVEGVVDAERTRAALEALRDVPDEV